MLVGLHGNCKIQQMTCSSFLQTGDIKMVNKNLFDSIGGSVAATNTINEAGGKAYSLDSTHKLCHYIVTGTFNNTYYAGSKEQLDTIKELCGEVDSETLAKLALYARQSAKMKDTPAYLLAVLAARGEIVLLNQIFHRVIDNVKMLLNFVQIVRSNVTGRKSFGTAIRRLIREWINSRNGKQLFIASIGHRHPSLVDVIKMVHPKPANEEQDALFAYLLGKYYVPEKLPQVVTEFEAFKTDNTQQLPDIPFQALSNCNLTTNHWKQISTQMGWNALRINLNTLYRNGVFEDKEVVEQVAQRLSNPENVRKFNAFPYQLLTTYQYTKDNMPKKIAIALHNAMEIATENIPVIDGDTAICIDYSGSMHSPVTGSRGTVSTYTTCKDVAGLIAVCLLRQNPDIKLIAWASSVKDVTNDFLPMDSVLTNCEKMNKVNVGGGTCAELGLGLLNQMNWQGKNIIYISDNQSWMRTNSYFGTTGLATEWANFKRKNKGVKMVNIHVQPYGSTQVQEEDDVLNIAGFSDIVFDMMGNFFNENQPNFVDVINNVKI